MPPKADRFDNVALRVSQHTALVKRIAYQMLARLPANIEVDDLIQVGLIGLMEAARSFDETLGVAFETHAGQRIRGAMLDELRGHDWLPRQLRRQLKDAEDAIVQLGHQLGHAPREEDIAQKLGLPLARYQQMMDDARGYQILHLEDLHPSDSDSGAENLMPDSRQDPLRTLTNRGFREALVTAIRALPEREKLLMGLYYEQDLNLKEIGEVMGVTESRVSQLHTQVTLRLRASLSAWLQNRDAQDSPLDQYS